MLSILIAARNEIYLEKTIRDILSNARGEIEVLVALDGYLPDPQIVTGDNRVIFYHEPVSIGQRQSINKLARLAKGKYIMKCDAHCAFDEGFDVKLAADCELSWTVIPRMYNLDVKTWKPKLHKLTDYMYITSPKSDKSFRAEYYEGSEYKKWHSRKELIDDTMACMGPCWFMHKDRFFEQGGCDEGHGSWGAMSIEVALKAWLSGGALKVNKKTWFSHWFRGDIGAPYHLSGHAVEKARQYSKDLWINDKWDKATRKLQWVVDKFNPPTWGEQVPRPRDKNTPSKVTLDSLTAEQKKTIDDFHELFFEHWNRYERSWLGTRIVKYPTDLFLYQMIIAKNKPDFIIETGAYMGGSALFFASMCELVGHGQVISIDRREMNRPQHKRIKYIIGRSTAVDTLEKIRSIVGNGSVMAILDSDHRRPHVKRELTHYGKIVTKGQYLVVEDTMLGHTIDWKYGVNTGPLEAVQWYMARTNKYVADPLELHYLISMCPHGWLRRV